MHIVTDSIDARVAEMAENISQGGPLALETTKRRLSEYASPKITQQCIDEAAQAIADVRITPEAQDGITAFLNKRSTSWVTALGDARETAGKGK